MWLVGGVHPYECRPGGMRDNTVLRLQWAIAFRLVDKADPILHRAVTASLVVVAGLSMIS